MGARLDPAYRCPHCHSWAPMVKVQNGKSSTNQTPETVDVLFPTGCLSSRNLSPAFLPSPLNCPLYCDSELEEKQGRFSGKAHFLVSHLQGTDNADKALFQKAALFSPLLPQLLTSGFSGKPQNSTNVLSANILVSRA